MKIIKNKPYAVYLRISAGDIIQVDSGSWLKVVEWEMPPVTHTLHGFEEWMTDNQFSYDPDRWTMDEMALFKLTWL